MMGSTCCVSRIFQDPFPWHTCYNHQMVMICRNDTKEGYRLDTLFGNDRWMSTGNRGICFIVHYVIHFPNNCLRPLHLFVKLTIHRDIQLCFTGNDMLRGFQSKLIRYFKDYWPILYIVHIIARARSHARTHNFFSQFNHILSSY